jgi:hypothetical protein
VWTALRLPCQCHQYTYSYLRHRGAFGGGSVAGVTGVLAGPEFGGVVVEIEPGLR